MPEYNFPSGEKPPFSMTEIEGKYLGRKKTIKDIPTWVFLLIMALILTATLFIVGKVVEIQKVHAQGQIEAIESQWQGYCARAQQDHLATNTAAWEDLQTMCPNLK